MKHDSRYTWLDLVRGLSALAVCASHLRAALLDNYAQVQHPGMLQKIFYFITGLGHESVMVFFVLSGMFVGGSVLRGGRKFCAAEYAIARLVRLWVVLLPALLLTAMTDAIIAAQAPEVLQGAYYTEWSSGPSAAQPYSGSGLTFLGNLLFLQTIFIPVFGLDAPLWSLANEFWYYATFPLIAFAAGRCGNPQVHALRVAAAVVAAAVILWLPPEIRKGYWVWLMGVVVYMIGVQLPNRRRWPSLVAASALFAAALAGSKTLGRQAALPISSDLLVGAAFACLCLVLSRWPGPQGGLAGRGIAVMAKGLSEISYSLYLIHFPFVVLIAMLACHGHRFPPDPAHVAGLMAWLAALLILGAVFWFLFEKRTAALRHYLGRRLIRRPQQASPAPQ